MLLARLTDPEGKAPARPHTELATIATRRGPARATAPDLLCSPGGTRLAWDGADTLQGEASPPRVIGVRWPEGRSASARVSGGASLRPAGTAG